MKKVSIFNEVIGPIMRGPSSSHTAASYHLGKIIRDLLDEAPKQVIISFAKNGSYAKVYHQQGSDLGFATGIMGKEIISDGFNDALINAENMGIDIQFKVKEFEQEVHPNTIHIIGVSIGSATIDVLAKSIGGGAVQVDELNNWPVHITGEDDLPITVLTDSRSPESEWLERMLGRLKNTVTEDGANLVVMVLPLAYQLDPDYPYLPQRNIVAICKELGLPALDLLPAFRAHSGKPLFLGRSEGYDDIWHLTPEGHRVTARTLGDFLRESGLLPAGAQTGSR